MAISEIKTGTVTATGIVGNTATSNERQVENGPLQSATATNIGAPYSVFQTIDNSPSLTFIAKATAVYKVYASIPLYAISAANEAWGRIFNTAGAAGVIIESTGTVYSSPTDNNIDSVYIQTLYNLTAGVSYTFDIQIACAGGSCTVESAGLGGYCIVAEQLTPDTSGIAISSKSFASEIISGGTRVVATPAKIGEYRTYVKVGGDQAGTDDAPTVPPTVEDGMLIYGDVNFASAGTTGQPGRWEIFVGFNKCVRPIYYAGAGRPVGHVCTDYYYRGDFTALAGTAFHYNPSTGVAMINCFESSAGLSTRRAAYQYGENGVGSTDCPSIYFDLEISDNPVGIGIVGYVGQVLEIACETAPPGTLECGQAVSRTVYGRLFAKIGTRFGVGDGSTTFDLPPRGVFYRPWDHGAGNDPDASTRTAFNGGNSGDTVGSRQAGQNKAHAHSLTAANPSGGVFGGGWAYTDPSSTGSNTTGTTGGNQSNPDNVNIMKVIVY